MFSSSAMDQMVSCGKRMHFTRRFLSTSAVTSYILSYLIIKRDEVLNFWL